MPWCVEAPEGGRLHVLLPKRTYVVGRKDCDIPLGGDACDKSVSRQHLKISIGNAPPETLQDPNARPSIFAEDTSKFGSSFDGVAVPKHAQLEIKDGTLNLGTGNTRARVFFTPLCFSTSLLNKEQQASLKAMCAEMGAALHANWKPGACVHHYLVMNELQVTTKVLSALLDAKPIVNVGYLEAILRGSESTALWDPQNFLPPINSTLLGENFDFSPRQDRQTMFSGRRFVFLDSNTAKKLEQVARAAGAQTVHCFNSNLPDDMIYDPNTAFFESGDQAVQTLCEQLGSRGGLIVSEATFSSSVLQVDDSMVFPTHRPKIRHTMPSSISASQHLVSASSQAERVPSRTLKPVGAAAAASNTSQSQSAAAASSSRVQESTRSFVASHFARSSSSTAKSKAKRTAINVDELESKDGVVEAELVVVPPDPRTRNFKRFKKHAAAGQQPEFPRPVVRLTFFEEQKEEK